MILSNFFVNYTIHPLSKHHENINSKIPLNVIQTALNMNGLHNGCSHKTPVFVRYLMK